MPLRRASALALLVLMSLVVLAPLGGDGCVDDGCAPDCGDCFLCAPSAELPRLGALAAPAVAGLDLGEVVVRPPAAPLRRIEHVPLAGA